MLRLHLELLAQLGAHLRSGLARGGHLALRPRLLDLGLQVGRADPAQAAVGVPAVVADVLGAARAAASEAGAKLAEGIDVQTQHQLVCPQCKSETHGAKFCPECGHKVGGPATCSSCSSEVPQGAKFCPECGTPA